VVRWSRSIPNELCTRTPPVSQRCGESRCWVLSRCRPSFLSGHASRRTGSSRRRERTRRPHHSLRFWGTCPHRSIAPHRAPRARARARCVAACSCAHAHRVEPVAFRSLFTTLVRVRPRARRSASARSCCLAPTTAVDRPVLSGVRKRQRAQSSRVQGTALFDPHAPPLKQKQTLQLLLHKLVKLLL